MSYDAAIVELRQILGDNATDKRTTRKQVIGTCDGANLNFRTYDKRILEDSFEVFVGETTQSVTLADPLTGEFTFSAAPAQNTKIVASYYWQWWLDEELQNFLNKGAESVGETDSVNTGGGPNDQAYLMIAQGLRSAALYYAAGHAQNRLIQFMMNRRHSGEFLLEQDKGGDEGFAALLSQMRGQAKDYFKQADTFRTDYYQRQGRRNAPAVAIKMGVTRRYGPSR